MLMMESSLGTHAGLPGSFPKSCLERLFRGELVSGVFLQEKLHSRRLTNFLEFQKHTGLSF